MRGKSGFVEVFEEGVEVRTGIKRIQIDYVD